MAPCDAKARIRELEAEVERLRTALQHVRSSAQTGSSDAGVVISFCALAAVRSSLGAENSSTDEPYNATLARQWTEASAKASRLEIELAAARVQIEDLQSHLGINRPQYPDQHPGKTSGNGSFGA